jgi:hypothetical protein
MSATTGRLALAAGLCWVLIAVGACEGSPSDRDGSTSKERGTGRDRGQGDVGTCASPKRYYPDADKDSFGSAAAQPVEACAPPAGYVTSNTDCADEDPNARPGQTEYFEKPIQGKTGNPFDYNCDGTVELKVIYPDVVLCENRGYTVCETKFNPAWWGKEPPKCGETRKIVTSCTYHGSPLNFTCDANFSGEKTQSCR